MACGNIYFSGKNTWHDNTNSAVLYPSDVRTWVVNIDSRFRDGPQSSSSTDFYIKLPRVYKNVISLRLTSIEVPNTWYAFSSKLGTNTITVSGTPVTISDGNYDPMNLASTVRTAIQTVLPSANVNFSSNTGKITIDNSSTFRFDTGTAQSCGSNVKAFGSFTPYSGGLGYLMGFTGHTYTGQSSYTGEYVVDTLRDNYILLQLPELEMMMESYSFGSTSVQAFAKIVVDVDKNFLIYNNAGDAISRAILFPQPTNLTGFRVRLVDAFGNPLDLMANFSFTLEIQEVLNSKTYEAYRTNLICPSTNG